MAKADGGVSSFTVFASSTENDYPEQWGSQKDGYKNIEYYIKGSLINHTALWGYQDDWNFNVTRMRFYIDGGTETGAGKAAVYEYLDRGPDWAGDLYGETAETSISQDSVWNNFYPANPISLPAGSDPQYYAVIWGDNSVGDFEIPWDNNPTTDGESLSLARTYPDSFPDPMTGESSNPAWDFWVQGYVTAYNYSSTTFNQYYGTTKIYTARRDFNITFPTTTGEQIQIFYPIAERLLNLTYSNGGLFDQILSAEDYTDAEFNVTHRKITLPTATIDSYGGDYRIFTKSYDYGFTLRGLFSENGTFIGQVNVTSHSPSNTTIHVLNGELEICTDEKPVHFSWGLTGGGTRRVYTFGDFEFIYIFTPDDDYASYSFYVKDYTGSIGSGDTFLEALRVINGTERVIERVLIWDTVNAVPLTLTLGQIYILQARLFDGTTYRFGYFTPGLDPTPTLTLSGIAFSDQAHYVGEHISVEATRLNGTHIQTAYENLLEDTTELFIEICYMNGTQLWNDTTLNDDIIFNWYDADNETDYIVNFEAYSEFYGKLSYSKALTGEQPEFPEPPDLDAVLGNGVRLMISIFLIFMGFIIFSAYTAVLGVFSGLTITYVLNYMNFIPTPIPWSILHALMGLLVMWALSGGNK